VTNPFEHLSDRELSLLRSLGRVLDEHEDLGANTIVASMSHMLCVKMMKGGLTRDEVLLVMGSVYDHVVMLNSLISREVADA
jgi:hypothetical protein